MGLVGTPAEHSIHEGKEIMIDLVIAETTVPTVAQRGGRAAKPNPYSEHVKRLSENKRTKDAEGLAFTFVIPREKGEDDAAHEKVVKRVVTKWRDAGAEHDVTVRSLIEPAEDKSGTTVTVWGIDRVTRNRGTDAEPAQA